ncbi:MAG: hypothetical protein ACHQTE_01970 [Candidatus Saccharimonadales bacterium]
MSQFSETSFRSNERPKTELEIARAETATVVKGLVDAMIDTPEQFALNDSLREFPEYNGDGEQEFVQATTNQAFVRASRTRSTDSEARDPNRIWTHYQLQITFGIGGDSCEIALNEWSQGMMLANYRDASTGQVHDARSDTECLDEIQTIIDLFRESAEAEY